MRFYHNTLILGFVLIGLGCSPEPRRISSNALDGIQCPKDMQPLSAWLDKELASFKASKYTTGGAWIHSRLLECRTPDDMPIDQHPQLAAVFNFTKSFYRGINEDHSMRLDMSDQEYFDMAPNGALEMPAALKNPSFLRLLDSHLDDGGQAITSYLNALNTDTESFRSFIFDSQFLKTPDDSQTSRRLFVLVSSQSFDKFFQFGLHETSDAPLASAISLVSIQKFDGDTGKALDTPLAWYKDFWRVRTGDTIELSSRLAETGSVESCFGCHSTALIPVYPNKETFAYERFEADLKDINKVIKSYAHAEIAHVSPTHYGPTLGPVTSPLRGQEFFSSCAGPLDLDQEALDRVREAMACESCHNDINRKRLRFPMATLSQIDRDSIVRVLVEDEKAMPPNSQLTDTERQVLVQCLYKEYFQFDGQDGLLESWLREW